MAWTHQPALDGVRSIAVYMVLLFHAGTAAFGNGFIGVDLFFVLSGFLVSSILLTELDDTGGVRLWRFYARRVRRLLPAAMVVIVATAAVFVLLVSSVRRLPLVGDAQAALLYVANWRFMAQESDYFGADVNRSPYLHFWSLSIEEQFYVVFPLLLLGLHALSRRRRWMLPLGIGALFAASVTAQVVWAVLDADHAYYGTDTRAYQLMAGVLAALIFRARPQRVALPPAAYRTAPFLAPAGLLVLLCLSSDLVTLHPSQRGLLATAASVALILGLVLVDDQTLARLLGRPLPLYLGRISYGTYLWHWPVVLVLVELFDTSAWVITVLTAGLATALAALSFEVLEHPIRGSRMLARRAPHTVIFGLAMSLLLAVAVTPALLESERRPALAVATPGGGVGRPVPTGVDWRRFANDRGPDDTYCTSADLSSCVIAAGGSSLHVALIGDSNARMLAPVLERLAAEHDFTLSAHVITACPWQHELHLPGRIAEIRQQCLASRDDLYDSVLSDLEVDVAVLLQLPRDRGKYLERSELSAAELDRFNHDAQEATIEEIAAAGARTVIIDPIIQVPLDLPEPLECLAGAHRTSACHVPVPLESPPSEAFIHTFAAERADVSTVTMNDLMCPKPPLCEPLLGRVPVWRDRTHYTPAALQRVRDAFWSRLEATGFFSPEDE